MPGMQLVWRIATLEFSVCIFTALLRLVCDGLNTADGCFCWPRLWDSSMPMSLPSGVGKILRKMGAMAVLCDSASDMSLGYKMPTVLIVTQTNCSVRHQDFPLISDWVKSLQLCGVECLQPVFIMVMANQ